MTSFRKTRAEHLSGGNKRKLSVAIALCANSRFVLLDEPSSGLDINARRKMWNMLKEYKKNRIVMLTTHYMDEADILGDRIGIMNEGNMTVLGSSLFLKRTFGEGYEMTILKQPDGDTNQIASFVRGHLGDKVQIVHQLGDEFTLKIPNFDVEALTEFFADFDEELTTLHVDNYGMELTTLENIFLAIGHIKEPQTMIIEKPDEN